MGARGLGRASFSSSASGGFLYALCAWADLENTFEHNSCTQSRVAQPEWDRTITVHFWLFGLSYLTSTFTEGFSKLSIWATQGIMWNELYLEAILGVHITNHLPGSKERPRPEQAAKQFSSLRQEGWDLFGWQHRICARLQQHFIYSMDTSRPHQDLCQLLHFCQPATFKSNNSKLKLNTSTMFF